MRTSALLARLRTREVRAALLAVLLARTAVNGGYRIVYPFLPEIARGLGVSLATVGSLLALRAASGLAAPLVPGLASRLGRRNVMTLAAGASIAGCLLLAGAPGVAVAAAGFVVLGLSKPLFDIPMQGWFGARVPYQRRGRVLGITELTWAASLALALPAGFLIAATDWRAPLLLVALLGVAGLGAVLVLIAGDRTPHRPARRLRLSRSALTLLAVVALFRFAAESLFVVYGSWLEGDFGLTVAAIGVFTMVVVAAELTGEGAVVAFADRLGLRRTVLVGLLGSAVAYAGLGLVGGSLALAVVAVVGWFVLFELTIVATIPLATELVPAARDRLLSLVATVAVASGGLAALVGPRLFAAGGIAASGLVAAACVLAAALLLAAGVRDPDTAPA